MNIRAFFSSIFTSKEVRITRNSLPAPSKGGIGHPGSKSPHPCHSRPARVAKRKAAHLARRLNRH